MLQLILKYYGLNKMIFKENKISSINQTRTIHIGHINEHNKRKNNKIKTSKYSLFNFIPKNLMEQFRRVANFYFLIVTIIAYVIESPVSPLTSSVPLIFVVTVTAIKQGYEDYLRHKTDNLVNNEVVELIIDDTVKETRSRSIVPGRLVRVRNGYDVPADLVMICCSDPLGKCHVTTANLDGETNLKTLRVPLPLVGYSSDQIPKDLKLEVPEPTADLYTFYGRLDTPGKHSVALTTDSLMLRGSRVKNTEWAIGCAVYTGEETKLALNSKFTSNKFSSSERAINEFLLCFILVMVMTIIFSYFMKRSYELNEVAHEEYLGPASDFSAFSIINDCMSFLLLYYYIIPISLYVTIEMYKFIGSLFIGWDKDMFCNETLQPALANTSDLNEELGQVEILFSDKTGTLTKNQMLFKMCSIRGVVYEEKNGSLYDSSIWKEPESTFKEDIKFFFTILALCHTVQLSDDVRRLSLPCSAKRDHLKKLKLKKNEKSSLEADITPRDIIPSKYQASSPDEKALVEVAERMKITFMGENGNDLLIKIGNAIETYQRLQVIEFTSERKRMSVVVRDKQQKIWLFCKGAESSVLPLCNDDELLEETNKHIDGFASRGLRTLAVAYREVPVEEYDKIAQDLSSFRSCSNDDNALREMTQQYKKLERELTLIGATAVEDCLQDDVSDTLSTLRKAGIKIWVLTGDKVETAINVAQSCAHITDDDKKMFILQIQNEEGLREVIELYKAVIETSEGKMLVLIVDGISVSHILDSKHTDDFINICMHCSAVLCCRLSPIQKAQIVKLIKSSPLKPITAAIGDGANDISMIQEAHVGFGIFGKEGRQAARSSDFAFTKFSMIKKLLLVLGHWYYQRLATLVQYFFYKNLTFANLMFLFQFHTQFSTQSIFDSMFLTTFNLFFTSLPCLVLSVTEQSRPSTTLLREPTWYKKNRRNRLLSWSNFSGWSILAIYHSIVIYVVSWLSITNDVINVDGKSVDLWCYGCALFHNLIIVVNMKEWLQARYQTYVFIGSIFFSIASFIALNLFYSSFNFRLDGDVLWTYYRLMESTSFWLSSIITVIFALLPDFLFRLFRDIYRRKKHLTMQ